MICKIKFRIGAPHPIVAAAAYGSGALSIDEYCSDIRPLKYVALHTEDGELLARNAETRRDLAQFARLHLQESDVVRTNLASDLRAVINRHGRAIISETDATGEESLIFSP